MRIAIDARMMGPEVTRGIGRYIEELIAAMLAVAPEHRYILITRQAKHRFSTHPSVETVVADIPWYGFAEQLKMSEVFKKIHPDVLHIPHWNVPVPYTCPYIITIHDLLLRHVPDSAKASTRGFFVRWIKRVGYRIILARAISHADKILVPTEFVAKDVARFYPKAASKIIVTGEGMPEVKAAQKVVDSFISNEKAESYLLYVGAAYPHKGLQDLIDAWPKIADRYPSLSLRIAGEKDVFMGRIEEQVQQKQKIEHSLMQCISFLGRVSDEELARLYEGATAFVYPTHYEGFGLPPLEALAHGCPVISSDAGPLPEVLGKEGVIFFRSGDANAILQAVQELMNDPDGARQTALRYGPILARRHDWKTAAAKTLGAYAAWHEG